MATLAEVVGVLSLSEENVGKLANAIMAAEHAELLTLHPELSLSQLNLAPAYLEGLRRCALAALKHLRQQAGLED